MQTVEKQLPSLQEKQPNMVATWWRGPTTSLVWFLCFSIFFYSFKKGTPNFLNNTLQQGLLLYFNHFLFEHVYIFNYIYIYSYCTVIIVITSLFHQKLFQEMSELTDPCAAIMRTCLDRKPGKWMSLPCSPTRRSKTLK